MTETGIDKENIIDSRWSVLAGVRFALAVCVLITHVGIFLPEGIFKIIGQTGYPAVFGFLMISGYSVAASITSRPRGYFIRRVIRIYPAYLSAIAFCCVVYVVHQIKAPDDGHIVELDGWKAIVGNILMLQGTLTHFIWIDGALWSLSVEWWCYMLAMLLVRLVLRITQAIIALSFIGLMVYANLYQFKTGSQMPRGLNFPCLAWAWLTGFVYYCRSSWINLSVMIILPLTMFDAYVPLKYASIIITCSALAIHFSSSIDIRSQSMRRALEWLGAMSYPLYLFHSPILFLVSSIIKLKNFNVVWVSIIVVVGMGYYASCRVFEYIRSSRLWQSIGGLQRRFLMRQRPVSYNP